MEKKITKKSQLRRRDIIKTAFALFLRKGYKYVTVQNIADAAYLSKGAVYHHFPSKEDIYLATLDVYFFSLYGGNIDQSYQGTFKEIVTTVYTFVAKAFGQIEYLDSEGIEFPIRSFYAYQLESHTYPDICQKVEQTAKAYQQLAQKIVEIAQEKKEIRSDVDAYAVSTQFLALIEGVAFNLVTQKSNVEEVMMEKYKIVFDLFLENLSE